MKILSLILLTAFIPLAAIANPKTTSPQKYSWKITQSYGADHSDYNTSEVSRCYTPEKTVPLRLRQICHGSATILDPKGHSYTAHYTCAFRFSTEDNTVFTLDSKYCSELSIK